LSEFVARAVKTPLLFKPGSKYSYQSMGILLAAEIIQRISGRSTLDFLDGEVFGPLGMRRTAMGLGRIKIEQTMRSQTEFAAPEAGAGSPEAADWDWNSPYWRNLGAPWGGAHSTAPDITRLLRSFLHPEGKVLKPETARAMIRNHTSGLDTARGLGFQLGPLASGCSDKTFGHGGSTGTRSWADPASDTSFVLLTTLPARESGKILIDPVSDLASQAA
jgi:beta-lactamase class C